MNLGEVEEQEYADMPTTRYSLHKQQSL